jgi:hypothetical protein
VCPYSLVRILSVAIKIDMLKSMLHQFFRALFFALFYKLKVTELPRYDDIEAIPWNIMDSFSYIIVFFCLLL